MTAALRGRALSIGTDPCDTADERFRKRLLVVVALIILPVGFVWGCLYCVVGELEVALFGDPVVAARTARGSRLRPARDVKGKGAVETWRLVGPRGG
jgi:hypothetical protein